MSRALDRTEITIPDHVVFRHFARETVVLNLTTGLYHGLNPTAGRMLEVLGEEATVGDAVGVLVAEYDAPREQIRDDLEQLLSDLRQRELIHESHG